MSRCVGPLGSLLPCVAGVIPSGKVSSGSFSALDFSGSFNVPSSIFYFLSSIFYFLLSLSSGVGFPAVLENVHIVVISAFMMELLWDGDMLPVPS